MATVFIGLPVFNGEAFIAETIESILRQTFTDFCLLISDNASLDNTGLICKTYEETDARIKYKRHAENIGWEENFKFTRASADTDYFFWIAADDPIHPEFIEELLLVHKQNPRVVGVMSDIVAINEQGEKVHTKELKRIRLEETYQDWDKKIKSFFEVAADNTHFSVYGLFKTKFIKEADINYKGLVKYASGWEFDFLIQLALHGPIVSIKKPLKYYRIHNNSMYMTEQRGLNLSDSYRLLFNVYYISILIIVESKINKGKKIEFCAEVVKNVCIVTIKFIPRICKIILIKYMNKKVN